MTLARLIYWTVRLRSLKRAIWVMDYELTETASK